MKLNRKSILWTFWAVSVLGLGSSLVYMTINMKTELSYLHFIFFVLLIVQFPLVEYLKKRKIVKGKKEFGIAGDISLDQIESLRIEKDYQEKYANKWKLNASNK
ncbi:MAG: hypothetical protein P8X96_18435 [Desulfobacteraceae bacterium]